MEHENHNNAQTMIVDHTSHNDHTGHTSHKTDAAISVQETHSEQMNNDDHAVHSDHSGHGGHGVDHSGHEQMFRQRFWISLILSIPVLLYSPSIQDWLNFSMPAFPGSQWIAPLFGVIVFVYGGLPFLQMAIPEIKNHKPGNTMTMMRAANAVLRGRLMFSQGGRYMDKIKFSMPVILVIVISMLLVGCGASSTPTPLPEQPFEVNFDGTECTYSGPTELPEGEYEIIFKNESELSGGEVYVFYLRDGHTHQDLVNVQSEPGEYFDNDWTVISMKDYVGWDEDNNNIYNFHLSDIGEYSIVANYEAQKNMWLCSPLKVIETTSE